MPPPPVPTSPAARPTTAFSTSDDPYAMQPGTPHPAVSQGYMPPFVPNKQRPRLPLSTPADPFVRPTLPRSPLDVFSQVAAGGGPRSAGSDIYVGPPGTPRPPPTSDPYSIQPGTPRPAIDSYAGQPGTPRPALDSYAGQPGTPRPALDPYASQPGTPRPQHNAFVHTAGPRPDGQLHITAHHLQQHRQHMAQHSLDDTFAQAPGAARPSMPPDHFAAQRPQHVQQRFSSPRMPLDPFHRPPGPQAPTANDPYTQQQVAPQDPYAQQPGTPLAMTSDPYSQQGGGNHQLPSQEEMQHLMNKSRAMGQMVSGFHNRFF